MSMFIFFVIFFYLLPQNHCNSLPSHLVNVFVGIVSIFFFECGGGLTRCLGRLRATPGDTPVSGSA